MFINFFKYQLKILLRDREVIFWTLVFPLILATFFNLAFARLTSDEKFEAVDVAVVKQADNSYFIDTLKQLDDDLINLQITDLDKAKALLEDEKISGYYLVDNDIELVVNSNGISETILESIVNEYLTVQSTVNNLAKLNPEVLANNILATLNQNNLINRELGDNTDLTVIYFYSLIGMNCLNASFCGLRTTNHIEANLSRKGTRVTVAPIAKMITVLSSILSAFIIQFINMMILMLYLVFGLHIDFGNQLIYIILLIVIGCFTGVGLGSLTGNLLKFKNSDLKITFLTSFSLVLSFFSGMMVLDIKYWIQNNFPIFAYINPVNLITDSLYALYYYDNLNRYTTNLICLIVISLLLIISSIIVGRRKQYDSL